MKKIFCYIINILFPTRCSGCGEILEKNNIYYLCKECLKEIIFIDENCCNKCGKELINKFEDFCYDCRNEQHFFDKAHSIVKYCGLSKKLLIKYKFNNGKEIANTLLSFLKTKVQKFGDIDVVIGVPAHKNKTRKRGFNQAEELAKLLANVANLNFDSSSLCKIKDTKSQSTLSKKQRAMNLKDSFIVTNNLKISNKVILIIDDIYTTGTTVSECARTLKNAGAKKVYVLTVASGEGY